MDGWTDGWTDMDGLAGGQMDGLAGGCQSVVTGHQSHWSHRACQPGSELAPLSSVNPRLPLSWSGFPGCPEHCIQVSWPGGARPVPAGASADARLLFPRFYFQCEGHEPTVLLVKTTRQEVSAPPPGS